MGIVALWVKFPLGVPVPHSRGSALRTVRSSSWGRHWMMALVLRPPPPPQDTWILAAVCPSACCCERQCNGPVDENSRCYSVSLSPLLLYLLSRHFQTPIPLPECPFWDQDTPIPKWFPANVHPRRQGSMVQVHWLWAPVWRRSRPGSWLQVAQPCGCRNLGTELTETDRRSVFLPTSSFQIK